MTGIPGILDTFAPGVPTTREPLWWDTAVPVGDNLAVIDFEITKYQKYIPVGGGTIDEAAIMVGGYSAAHRLIAELNSAGWHHFNTAADLVYTNPFGTRYFVNYEFLQHRKWQYRLEVMFMGEGRIDGNPGFSPLHQALWHPNGVPGMAPLQYPIPHLSYKPPLNAGYDQARAAYSRAVAGLQANGLIHAQTCQSTYGTFGYYLPQDATRQLYLKPRVNTRDAK